MWPISGRHLFEAFYGRLQGLDVRVDVVVLREIEGERLVQVQDVLALARWYRQSPVFRPATEQHNLRLLHVLILWKRCEEALLRRPTLATGAAALLLHDVLGRRSEGGKDGTARGNGQRRAQGARHRVRSVDKDQETRPPAVVGDGALVDAPRPAMENRRRAHSTDGDRSLVAWWQDAGDEGQDHGKGSPERVAKDEELRSLIAPAGGVERGVQNGSELFIATDAVKEATVVS